MYFKPKSAKSGTKKEEAGPTKKNPVWKKTKQNQKTIITKPTFGWQRRGRKSEEERTYIHSRKYL